MRIVEIIAGLGLGGAERALAARLEAKPPDIVTRVINTRPSLGDLESRIVPHAEVRHVHPARGTRRAIRDMVGSFQPDVAVIHNPSEVIRMVLWPPRDLDLPWISLAHSDKASFRGWISTPVALALPWANRNLAGTIAVSTRARHGEQCRWSKRVEVVNLGSSLDSHARPEDIWRPSTRLRWLYLGRLTRPKNLPNLLRAMESKATYLRGEGVELVLVGSGELEPDLRRQVSSRGLADLITFHPPIDDPSSILRAADALIIASTHEGGPLTAYEALLAGTRILGTPVGVVQEVCSDDPGCIVVKDSSRTQIAEGLVQLAQMGPLSVTERHRREQRSVIWDKRHGAERFYIVLRTLIRPAT